MRRERPTSLNLNDAARAAIKTCRDSKPWRGTAEERGDKFADLHRGLARAYDLETMLLPLPPRPKEVARRFGRAIPTGTGYLV